MSKELKVGAFVLVSLLIFLGTLIYVDQLGSAHIPYKTYFNYVGGVDPGSQVRFGGMKVGSITAIHPWRKDPTKIEILLEVKADVPINADSVAMLTSISPLATNTWKLQPVQTRRGAFLVGPPYPPPNRFPWTISPGK